MNRARERKTVELMIRRYCRGVHVGGRRELCADCRSLLAYAEERLFRCPWGEGKPACARCHVHCYAPEQRGRIKAVMRYAGPRMLVQHPLLALAHLLTGLRRPSRPA